MSPDRVDLDDTHDPALESWVASANDPEQDFPLQNLPFGSFVTAEDPRPRPGVAIGDRVLDLWRAGLQPGRTLAAIMADDLPAQRALRLSPHQRLRRGAVDMAATRAALLPMHDVRMVLPCVIGDYTDFYIGIHHARAVGALFRPEQPLMPNYHWLPIAYHGRASSLRVSGNPVRRPWGQSLPPGEARPVFAPSQRLDFELELGALIGTGNDIGTRVPLGAAEQKIFGLVLLNDWSARDIQAWEYQPLGPFLGKNFATTVSAWVVTLEALRPFRRPWQREAGAPPPLAYLDGVRNRASGALDIDLTVKLQSATMRAQGHGGDVIVRSGFADAAHWTLAQMVTHHTVNGCPLRTGDLLGTGTLSGPGPGSAGSLLELSAGGRTAITLSNGEQRRFLEDGDTVTLQASARRQGMRRIGFGFCQATVLPALPADDAGRQLSPGSSSPGSIVGRLSSSV